MHISSRAFPIDSLDNIFHQRSSGTAATDSSTRRRVIISVGYKSLAQPGSSLAVVAFKVLHLTFFPAGYVLRCLWERHKGHGRDDPV
jgi:hypothetical protein